MSVTELIKKQGGTLKPMKGAKITPEVKEYEAALKRGEKIYNDLKNDSKS